MECFWNWEMYKALTSLPLLLVGKIISFSHRSWLITISFSRYLSFFNCYKFVLYLLLKCSLSYFSKLYLSNVLIFYVFSLILTLRWHNSLAFDWELVPTFVLKRLQTDLQTCRVMCHRFKQCFLSCSGSNVFSSDPWSSFFSTKT